MSKIESFSFSRVQPIEQQFVYIIAKKSARFKEVNLSEVTDEKMELYADRFVSVLFTSNDLAQVFIGPNAPFRKELMENFAQLTLDGKQIQQVHTLSEEEYLELSEATMLLQTASKDEKKEKSDESNTSIAENRQSEKKASINSSKSISSLQLDLMTSKVQQCFHRCCAKTLETFIEMERKLAELDKEADQAKKQKKKEIKELFLAIDILREEIKSSLLKATQRLNSLRS